MLMGLSRSAYKYRPQGKDDSAITKKLSLLAKKYPRYGFRKMFHTLRKQGHAWNHKKVYRIYCDIKLNLKRKPKKRLASREKEQLMQPFMPNECWSLDYMSDVLACGKRFRTANVIDDYNRQVIGIKASISLPSKKITELLDHIGLTRGYPKEIRVDNGPENIAQHMKEWARGRGIRLKYIQPGKPAQNAYIERLNKTYRQDVLDMYIFKNIQEVQEITDKWIYQYNNKRPHHSLGNMTPIEYLRANNFSIFELY